jgi:hypothetical protein
VAILLLYAGRRLQGVHPKASEPVS